MSVWELSEYDRQIWEQELDEFVPERIFDAHAHIWDESCANANTVESMLRDNSGYDELQKFYESMCPGREVDCNLLSSPVPGMDFERNTEFMALEMAKSRYHVASMGISPELSDEFIIQSIEKYHFKGLKPYLLFTKKAYEADILDFLPESQIEIADHYGLNITLHLSKSECCSDKKNLDDLAYLTERYPNVRWILAHCARSFNPVFLEESIDFLRDLPNIWYDLSAVTELYSHYLLFKKERISRLMFGSDNIAPAGNMRGNYVSFGRSWSFYFCKDPMRSTTNFYEQLRSQKRAAEMAGLSKEDVRKFFFDNAADFFDFAE